MTDFSHKLDIDIPGLDSHFIDGAWRNTGTPKINVISPSTEETLTAAAAPDIEVADMAASAARRAFDDGPWPRMTLDERIATCERFCDALENRLEIMNRAWAFESGATIAHGEIINDYVGKLVWRQMLVDAKAIPWEEQRADATLYREPIGTVLSIMTFNGPIVLVGMKIIPALLAGCTVVAKFAPESPLTSRFIAEAANEAGFPEGVINILAADTPVTQHLVSHKDIDMVSLTGGTAIGVDVVKRTADRLARTALELGGKSPAIIAEDADLDAVMETLVGGSTGFMGQVCVTLSRILAPESKYDEVVERLAGAFEAIKIGDPFDPSTERGPLAVERGRTRCERYVDIAKREGGQIVTGGKRPPQFKRGWWYEPTLITNVDNSMTVAREEVFGPVTTVIPVRGMDEAVRIANDSPFGLAASIYSSDIENAKKIARQIQSGSVAINMAGISFMQPFGGYKQSGWGRECGPEGIMEFTQIKQVVVA